MYKITVTIDVSPEKLIGAFENQKDITKWNTTLSKQEILKQFTNSNAKISYQVTTEAGPGGVVSARDFIFIGKAEKRGNAWMEGGVSIEYPGPKTSKIVRYVMPCPFKGPNHFCGEYQSFWTGPIHFGHVQIILYRSKL